MAALLGAGGGAGMAASQLQQPGQLQQMTSPPAAQQQPGPVPPQAATNFAQGLNQGPNASANLLTFLQNLGIMNDKDKKQK